MFPHCSKGRRAILCLRTGQGEALESLDGHHLRSHSWSEESPGHFCTLVTAGKPCRAALRLLRPIFVLKPGSGNLHFCNGFHTAKICGHELKARPKGRFKAQSSSLCFSSCHCWHHTGIAAHIVLHNKNGELNRGDLDGAFKSARNCQEEGKLFLRGL